VSKVMLFAMTCLAIVAMMACTSTASSSQKEYATALNMAEPKVDPKAGSRIGFDFQTNDDGNGEGVRSGIKDWANTTNQNYQNAS
jgi:ABC-type sugar transport system substrate-binding protein